MTTTIDTLLLTADATLSEPDVSRLTTQSIDGTGVFDILMKTTKLHLMEEYNSNRITGEEYSTVYLTALTSVMQASLQYLLNSQQEEQIQADIALTRQKTVSELAQTDDDIPLGLGFNGDANIEGLVALQKEKLELEKELASAQITQSEREGALVGQKVVTELAQTADNISQAAAASLGYNVTTTVDGLIRAQLDKLEQEAILTEQKTATETAQTSDTKPITLGVMESTSAITGMALTLRDKTNAEANLYAQKTNTELAQTSDTVTAGDPMLNTTTVLGGITKVQKDLYTAQTNGYQRNAEQQAAKILTDAWSIDAAAGDAVRSSTDGNNLDDPSIGAVIAKLKLGVL